MTAPSAEQIKQERKSKAPQSFYIRKIRPTTSRAGNPILEIPIPQPGAGVLLIEAADKDALTILGNIGITVHDGGKFYLNDRPMELDKDQYLDAQIEISPSPSGRKLSGAKSNKIDAGAAAGMTDGDFFNAWEHAAKIVTSLKTGSTDPAIWFPRAHRVIVQFCIENGFGEEWGKKVADELIEQAKAVKACGDVVYIQNHLKKRLREDFPEGVKVAAKFEREGAQADVALLIADEMSNRISKRYGTGKVLEIHVLGEPVVQFVKDQKSYEGAKALVKKFFEDYDKETDLRQGIAAIEGEHTDLSADDFKGILKGAILSDDMTDTMDLVQSLDYDKALILAAYRSAVEAFKVKDVPKFENGIKDKSDAEAVDALKNADIKDPESEDEPSPTGIDAQDENAKFADNLIQSGEAERIMSTPPITAPPEPASPPPAEKPAEPPKALTADDWKRWREEQAANLSLAAIEIDTLLGITKEKTYRQFATLEDGTKTLKSAVAKQKMLADSLRITREFGVPDDVSLRWIEEGYDRSVGETLEEVAENWRTAEQFVAKIKSKAVEYQAKKADEPAPNSAIVPASQASLSVAAVPQSLRSIPVPSPNELAAMKELAAIAGDTHFYKGIANYGQAMMVMYTGFELGLGLTFSLKHIPVVNGSPWPDAECHRALALKSGFVEWLDVKGDATQATCSIRRKGQTEIQTVTYTIDDARTAGLTGNATYTKHPADMLVARATIRAVRRFVPEAGAGIIGDTENVVPDEEAA